MSSTAPNAVFRPLRDEDRDFLWEMLRLAVFFPGGGPQLSLEAVKSAPLAAYVESWMRPGDFGVIVSVGGKPAGAAWARFFTQATTGYGYVSPDIPEMSMALYPGLRGQGLGRGLVERLIAAARTRAGGLTLGVSHENPAVPSGGISRRRQTRRLIGHADDVGRALNRLTPNSFYCGVSRPGP